MGHRELEALLVVAHAELEREPLLGRREPFALEPRQRVRLEIAQDRGQIGRGDLGEAPDVARRELPLHVGDEEAEGREDAGRGRDDRDAGCRASSISAFAWSGPAPPNATSAKRARVLTALDGDEAKPARASSRSRSR